MSIPPFQIRARYTDTTVTVYQAYTPAIGVPAARDGRFPPSWKRERMTWVKPSYLWMMYRCGWGAQGEPGDRPGGGDRPRRIRVGTAQLGTVAP
ncbi:DUF4291 family protein [Nocardiopsis terrae]